MSDSTMQSKFRISPAPYKAWMADILQARGFDADESMLAAEFAVIAAQHEVETHGGRKLFHLLDDEMKRSHACQPGAQHDVLVEGGAVEVWDANLKLGPAIAWMAQSRAAEVARSLGIGCVCVRNTNHFGWGGAYAIRFMQEGLISGNVCQGAIPIVTPTAGDDARMGSNAVSIALETHNESCPMMLWDAGIGALSWGEVQRSRLDGAELRPGCAVDAQGTPTTNAELAASLLPAGSLGNSLGVLIELLSAQFGAGDPRYRSVPPTEAPENEPVTCSFIHFAVDLTRFDGLAFPHGRSRAENVAAMVDALFAGNGAARVSGLRKWQAKQRSDQLGGLLFAPESIDAFRTESGKWGVPLPEVREVSVDVTPIHVAHK